MISKHILEITFSNEPELIFHFCMQLNGFTYFYLMWIILFTIDYLFTHTLMISSIAMYNKHFNLILIIVYTQLNDQTVLFPTIQFSMSTKLIVSKYCKVSLSIQLKIIHLFTHS